MFVKKLGNRIVGAELTSAEKKAMEIEIKKELAEYDKCHTREIDAIILWILHEQFGFGPKRLREAYLAWSEQLDALIGRYELNRADTIWLCTKRLKEYGIDLEEWAKERDGE